MIVVTGGAGFIGSALVWALNQRGQENIIIVDNLNTSEKWKNLRALKFVDYYSREDFLHQIKTRGLPWNLSAILHMGACSTTTEKDSSYLMCNNYEYTKILSEYAISSGIRFLYASSGATYGDGELGFDDSEQNLDKFRPLNMYGYSKHLFDQHAHRWQQLDKIAGLKFFNVFGPNEYHKGEMASKIFKAYHELKTEGKLKLFKSYNENYADGASLRDFVYVKDVVKVTLQIMDNPLLNGLFNIGTGIPRSWNDLAKAIGSAMPDEAKGEFIDYIEMPEYLKNKYQYYTCASIDKLRNKGIHHQFMTLEESVNDYITTYLKNDKFLGDE